MRILIVRLFPNQVNINSYNLQEIGLAKALIRKGNQCDIVYYTKGKDREQIIKVDEDKQITIFWMKGINFLKNGLYGNKIIKLANNYDIVQSSEYDQIYNLKLNKRIGHKLVIYHGPYYSKFNKGYNLKCKIFDRLFLNRIYKKAKFITKSELATEFLKIKGFENVETIGVGLDTDKFKENNNLENEVIIDLKKQKNNSKYILYIGKIEKRRNIKELFKIIKKAYDIDNTIKLIIVGKGEENYIVECFQYAKKLDIFKNIIYIPELKQKDLPSLYKICDIFMLPTSYDIFGMVLLEAMYEGIPVITTLNGGSDTIIEHSKDGFIYKLEEEDKVTNEVLKLIKDKEYRKNIGANATNTIDKKFTWECLSNRFLEIYNEKLGGVNDKKR